VVGRRALACIVVVASAAAATTSVDQLLDARDAKDRADIVQREARERTGRLLEGIDRVEGARVDAAARTERDASAARAIDDSVVLLRRMRADIEEARAEVATATGVRDKRQAKVDVLAGCRATIDSATRGLGGPGGASAAALVLEAGRARCQEALALAKGDTGAVHPYDFADPHVTEVDGTYYAYGTNGPAGTVQVLASTDLATWRVLPPALVDVAPWARPGWTWAPSVVRVGGAFVLYYTVRAADSGKQCISSAVALTPAGPFVDRTPLPLACQVELGGSIDPSPYRDDFGFLRLTWKSEGETTGGLAQIWSQPLTPDGRWLAGTPTLLLTADQPWEDRTIENPSMAKVGPLWILLYSANRWNGGDYATGYAVCAGATGPCTRPERPVVLASGPSTAGPGGAQHFPGPGGAPMVAYAAWDRTEVGHPNARRLHVAPVRFDGFALAIG
jgi:hypothetical protein